MVEDRWSRYGLDEISIIKRRIFIGIGGRRWRVENLYREYNY